MSESLCVTKDGFLLKQGGFIKTWHKRWFSLIGKTIFYADDQGSPEKGSINLDLVSEISKSPESRKPNSFKLVIPNVRTYYLCGDDVDAWIDAINRAKTGVDNLKSIKVEDLEIIKQISMSEIRNIQYVCLKTTAQRYIMKAYPIRSPPNQELIDSIVRSRSTLLKMSHPFLAPLKFIISNDASVNLIYECAPAYSLLGHLRLIGKFDETSARIYFAEIFLGLRFLSEQSIFYGDINGGNILAGEDGHVKVSGPGILPNGGRPVITEYSSPESIEGDWNNIGSTLYSAGVILYEMICGAPPFWDRNPDILRQKIQQEKIRFPFHVSDNAKDLINRLMNRVPSKRIGMGQDGLTEITAHPFFSGMDWEQVARKQIAPFWVPNLSIDKLFFSIGEAEEAVNTGN